jgi:hypothetical protein
MLVVMQAESSPAEIDAVCQRAREAGFEATVYDVEPVVIVLAGEPPDQAAEQFAGLPGVARIIPISRSHPSRATCASPVSALWCLRRSSSSGYRSPPRARSRCIARARR